MVFALVEWVDYDAMGEIKEESAWGGLAGVWLFGLMILILSPSKKETGAESRSS